MPTASLLSINRADPVSLRVGRSARPTGHYKRAQAGMVHVELQGLCGDFIGNAAHHGGPDQAVYLFSQADNLWWSRLFGRELEPGFFGENLTLEAWWEEPRVGDQLRCGELLLELTGPRTPCATLEARAGVKGLVREFVKAERCGAYARVLRPGAIRAGERFEIDTAPRHSPTIAEIFRYWHGKGDDAEFLERALAAPLASRIAATFSRRLAHCRVTQDH